MQPKRMEAIPKKDTIPTETTIPKKDTIPKEETIPTETTIPKKDTIPKTAGVTTELVGPHALALRVKGVYQLECPRGPPTPLNGVQLTGPRIVVKVMGLGSPKHH